MALTYESICVGGLVISCGTIVPVGIQDCAGSCGTAGQVLTSDGSNVVWAASAAPSAATPTVAGIVKGCVDATNFNTSLGCNALLAVTPSGLSGSNNVAIGINAACSLTTGFANIAIGPYASCATTGAGNTIAIGCCALKNNTFANNLAIGSRAMLCPSTSTYNIAIGNDSRFLSTAGDNNISIGMRSMRGSTGDYSVAIGTDTLTSATGSNNIAIGEGAGQNVTSGASNLFLGLGTGGFIITGSCNVFIGQSTGPLSDVSCCLAIGVDTLSWLTGDSTGAIKPAKGIIDCAGSCGGAGQILASNGSNAICWTNAATPSAATPTVEGIVYGTTTGDNTGLGGLSLYSVTSGRGNTAIGIEALCSTTSGGYNVAVGQSSAWNNTTGSYNTAIGVNSLQSNTTGCFNNAQGQGAIGANVDGDYNNGMGWGALGVNSSGSYNTAVGNKALNCNTSGSFNVAFGSCALCAVTTGCCNVGVGPAVQVVDPTASCQLAIGFSATDNWLTGDSSKNIKPGASIVDCNDTAGYNTAVLTSDGAGHIVWSDYRYATPTAPGTVNGAAYIYDTPYNDRYTLAYGPYAGCSYASVGTVYNNTLIGAYAGCALSAGGQNNTLVGSYAGKCMVSGYRSVLIGEGDVGGNAEHSQNTLIGWANGQCMTGTSSQNVVIGASAGYCMTTGSSNIVLAGSLTALTSGSCNVMIVAPQEFVITTGSCNVLLGSGISASGATVCNEVTIGTTLAKARFQGAASAWSFVSDARQKENITALPVGRDFINDLQPRKFSWIHTQTEQGGFVAQEVDEVVAKHDADYLNLVNKDDDNSWMLAQTNLIPVLVKAVQELDAELKSLKQEFNDYRSTHP